MARSEMVEIPPHQVTELSDGDISGGITFQNRSQYQKVLVVGTTDSSQPSPEQFARALEYEPGFGYSGDLADLFHGQTYVRLWAWAQGRASMSVYHG